MQYFDKLARLYLNMGVIGYVSYDPNLVSFVRVIHLSKNEPPKGFCSISSCNLMHDDFYLEVSMQFGKIS